MRTEEEIRAAVERVSYDILRLMETGRREDRQDAVKKHGVKAVLKWVLGE